MSIEAKVSLDTLKLALEALVKLSDAADGFSVSGVYFNEEHWAKECLNKSYDAITALRQSIEQAQKQEALDRKAENARELGLDYEPEPVRLECVKCGTVYADGIPPQTTQKQEPVAWMHPDGRLWTFGKGFDKSTFTIPLFYTTPPQRKPLTDEEIGAILEGVNAYGTRLYTFARAIEAAHGIKE